MFGKLQLLTRNSIKLQSKFNQNDKHVTLTITIKIKVPVGMAHLKERYRSSF